jgi:hypothetical protein
MSAATPKIKREVARIRKNARDEIRVAIRDDNSVELCVFRPNGAGEMRSTAQCVTARRDVIANLIDALFTARRKLFP